MINSGYNIESTKQPNFMISIPSNLSSCLVKLESNLIIHNGIFNLVTPNLMSG